jgi:PHD/YefM family antitoxin component YafN of YafNO toxin-antitoxin module
MPQAPEFSHVSIDQAQSRLSQLLGMVCRNKGRIEIRGHDGLGSCVLISKDELESLEQALEILSNTSDVQKIARTIAVVSDAAVKAPLAPATRLTTN